MFIVYREEKRELPAGKPNLKSRCQGARAPSRRPWRPHLTFFWFNYFSHTTYLDHGEMYVQSFSWPLSALWRHVSTSPLPYAQACPKKIESALKKRQNKNNKAKNKRKRVAPIPYSSFADTMKEGMGRNSGCSSPSAPNSSASNLLSSSLSPLLSSHSDASLSASLSTGGGTRLPTSVVERNSSTG
jgi:hypothetical protein